jgi:tetratricopeptide (TPR) repeat protein
MTRRRLLQWRWVLLVWFSVQLFSQDLSHRILILSQEAEKEEHQGDIKGASEKYQAVLRLDPKRVEAYTNLGRLLLEQGQYEEAEKYLKQAIAIKRNESPPHQLLGIAYFQLGNFDLAEGELENALRIGPHDRETVFFLARTCANLGNLRRAARLLEGLRDENPREAKVLYTLGLVYMKLGDSTLEDLHKLDPESYLNDLLMGTAAEEQEEFAEAIKDFQNAVAKAPDAPGLHYALANALYLDGRLPEALKEFERENQIDPYNYMAHVLTAVILLSENPEKALEASTQAIELKPELGPGHLVRGRALLSLKRPKDAITDLKKAAALDPNEKTVHFQLALAYEQLGLTREAKEQERMFESMSKAQKAVNASHAK